MPPTLRTRAMGLLGMYGSCYYFCRKSKQIWNHQTNMTASFGKTFRSHRRRSSKCSQDTEPSLPWAFLSKWIFVKLSGMTGLPWGPSFTDALEKCHSSFTLNDAWPSINILWPLAQSCHPWPETFQIKQKIASPYLSVSTQFPQKIRFKSTPSSLQWDYCWIIIWTADVYATSHPEFPMS